MIDLSKINTSALLAELKRRCAEGGQRQRPAIVPCDECQHFRPFAGPLSAEASANYNPCAHQHIMLFRLPETADPNGEPWGFYRPRCRDRVSRDTLP